MCSSIQGLKLKKKKLQRQTKNFSGPISWEMFTYIRTPRRGVGTPYPAPGHKLYSCYICVELYSCYISVSNCVSVMIFLYSRKLFCDVERKTKDHRVLSGQNFISGTWSSLKKKIYTSWRYILVTSTTPIYHLQSCQKTDCYLTFIRTDTFLSL